MPHVRQLLCMALTLGFTHYDVVAHPTDRWDFVPQANSYLGVIFTERGHDFFITPDTQILAQNSAAEIHLSTYTSTGRLRQKVRPYRVDVAPPPKTSPSISLLSLGNPTSNELAIQELEQDKKEAFSQTPYRYLSTHVGLGQESLRASNRDSHFSGKSQVATFGLELQVKLTPRSSLATTLHVHSFVTSTETNQKEEMTAVRSSYLTTSYVYRLEALSYPHTSIQVGVGAVELPLLLEPETSKENSALRSTFATGPYIGIQYLHPLVSLPTLSFGGTVASLPTLLGSTSGKSLEASGQTLFFPVDNLYLRGALVYRYQKITGSIACARHEGCRESAETNSDLQLVYIGIGVFF
jgi:hypothetical protein